MSDEDIKTLEIPSDMKLAKHITMFYKGKEISGEVTNLELVCAKELKMSEATKELLKDYEKEKK